MRHQRKAISSTLKEVIDPTACLNTHQSSITDKEKGFLIIFPLNFYLEERRVWEMENHSFEIESTRFVRVEY